MREFNRGAPEGKWAMSFEQASVFGNEQWREQFRRGAAFDPRVTAWRTCACGRRAVKGCRTGD